MAEFIAEISSNHNGDLERCRKMIREAARLGCRGVKFQLFRIEKLFAPEILQVSEEHRLRRHWELPLRFVPELVRCAHNEGLLFGCSPSDLDAVDQLAPLVDFLKIASYELPWVDLVHQCATTGLPLMISTGMADAAEAWTAVETAADAGCSELTILHCVSQYPVQPTDCNLAAIGTLRELMSREFAPIYVDTEFRVGWSDHSVSPGVIARAINHWGAEVVEFHLDLEGEGDEFGGGHCWLPGQIEPVILGGYLPVQAGSDGLGRIAPTATEQTERLWRTDPADGLRPLGTTRTLWARDRRQVAPAGATVYMIPRGSGLGHVMRCLAVAEVLRRDHKAWVHFVVEREPEIMRMVQRHGFMCTPCREGIGVVRSMHIVTEARQGKTDEIAVIDVSIESIEERTGLVNALRDLGMKTVVVDDPTGAGADLAVVPAFGWESPAKPDNLIGGTEYLLIRGDVTRLRPTEPAPVPEQRIVVTFGGADPHGLTRRMVEALHFLEPEHLVQVVLSPGIEGASRQAAAMRDKFPRFQFIDTGDPLESLMLDAALVITAMGVTVGEALALGTPVAILANNPQDQAAVDRLQRAGVVHSLGFHGTAGHAELCLRLSEIVADPVALITMGQRGFEKVDGRGAERTAARIMQLVEGAGAP